jgi:uncharacterized protein (AIM24 family)
MKSTLFAPENQEKTVQGSFGLQNSRLLKIALNGDFLARQGAAVAWQGNVNFAFEGAGAKKMLKKMLTGEDLQLMRVSGQGDVFLANYAAEVHIIQLENDAITLNGENVLAFDSSLNWDIKFNKSFSAMGSQGMTNVVLQGTGSVAITSIGTPVQLETGSQPTFCDPAAAIAWSNNLAPKAVKTDSLLKSFIGRGSGEAISLGFEGPGWVIVQPSEGYPWAMTAQADSKSGGGLGSLLN